MKKLLLALFFLAFATCADAATCFWVGGTASWSTANAASWSSSSGGTASTCAATGGIPKQAADTATFDGSSGGGTVTVDSTMNGTTLTAITSGAFTGTIDFSVNNPSMTMGQFVSNGSGTRTLKMGSGTFTLITIAGIIPVVDFSTITGLTFTAGTSTFSIQLNQGAVLTHTFIGGGQTFANVSVSGGSIPGTWLQINNSNTFGTLAVTAPASILLNTNTTLTITNAFTLAGSSSSSMVFLGTYNPQSTQKGTISIASGTATCAWCAIQNLTFSGGATFSATNSIDLQGNTGISISGPSGGGGHIIGG
jgi:hypothetical protein